MTGHSQKIPSPLNLWNMARIGLTKILYFVAKYIGYIKLYNIQYFLYLKLRLHTKWLNSLLISVNSPSVVLKFKCDIDICPNSFSKAWIASILTVKIQRKSSSCPAAWGSFINYIQRKNADCDFFASILIEKNSWRKKLMDTNWWKRMVIWSDGY